jgi:hypothetical protein
MMQINNNNPNITLLEMFDTATADGWSTRAGTQAVFRLGNREQRYLYSVSNASAGQNHWQTSIYRLTLDESNNRMDGPAVYSAPGQVDFNTAVNAAFGLNG